MTVNHNMPLECTLVNRYSLSNEVRQSHCKLRYSPFHLFTRKVGELRVIQIHSFPWLARKSQLQLILLWSIILTQKPGGQDGIELRRFGPKSL